MGQCVWLWQELQSVTLRDIITLLYIQTPDLNFTRRSIAPFDPNILCLLSLQWKRYPRKAILFVIHGLQITLWK